MDINEAYDNTVEMIDTLPRLSLVTDDADTDEGG
jgi:hypothetical protein